MVKLLALISLILAVVLFPPATLALISNNAVPGDRTYPIKRGLEDVIYAVASINSTTKAWFSAARSDRRFDEVGVLVAQGKKTEDALNELVEQTRITASQIAKVSDPIQKEKLKVQLSTSIKKYEIAMEEFAKVEPVVSVSTTEPQDSAFPTATTAPRPIVTPRATTTPIPTQTPRPTVTPRPTPTPIPTASATARPTLRPTPSPTPIPVGIEPSPCDSIENPYLRTRCELGRTQHGLSASSIHDSAINSNSDSRSNMEQENDKKENKDSIKDKEDQKKEGDKANEKQSNSSRSR